ncbi:MAG TPA: type I glyceraldehyde-3-phosphate dehydrogenase [bacterium]|nr:type I glyceraldehyde-3-phosphate dehydrogenase [bacterium]
MAQKIRVAINGFGRIGRMVFRIGFGRADMEFVTINDLTDAKTLAHLLKYDSVAGIWPHEVKATETAIVIDGKEIPVTAIKDGAQLNYKNIDVVVESTGKYAKKEKAEILRAAGAKKVLISAPANDSDITLVLGVNDKVYDPAKHHVISNASCTTNCYAPVTYIIHKYWKIKKGFMTTIHSYTNDQRILDLEHKDLRRARAGALSMIPTTTGAAKAVGLVIPELKGKFDGISIRVPTPNVSLVDAVYELESEATKEEVNAKFREYANGPLKGILAVSDEELVSKDFNGNPHSGIVDAPYTQVMGGNLLKVLAWYDNEWGYSNRMIDVITKVLMK